MIYLLYLFRDYFSLSVFLSSYSLTLCVYLVYILYVALTYLTYSFIHPFFLLPGYEIHVEMLSKFMTSGDERTREEGCLRVLIHFGGISLIVCSQFV